MRARCASRSAGTAAPASLNLRSSLSSWSSSVCAAVWISATSASPLSRISFGDGLEITELAFEPFDVRLVLRRDRRAGRPASLVYASI